MSHILIVLSLLVAAFTAGQTQGASPFLAIEDEAKTAPSPTTQVPPSFKDGGNCLFIGHSFFIPVARYFDKIASRSGFSRHQAQLVFAPGKRGSPGDLWRNSSRRKQIEDKLASGKIDLLGMTTFSSKTAFKDYQRWIDLALKYNPNTQFFIGQCWTFGGPKRETKQYDQAIEANGDHQFKIVRELRKSYPNNLIYFINYGKIASEMKRRFSVDQLPDITKMVGRDKGALFRDGFMGHAGPMMLELSSLVWLNILYGTEIEQLKHSTYQSDVKDITMKVIKFNQKYR